MDPIVRDRAAKGGREGGREGGRDLPDGLVQTGKAKRPMGMISAGVALFPLPPSSPSTRV